MYKVELHYYAYVGDEEKGPQEKPITLVMELSTMTEYPHLMNVEGFPNLLRIMCGTHLDIVMHVDDFMQLKIQKEGEI